MDRDRTGGLGLTLAALTLAAAAIHFAMTPQHGEESVVLGIGFVVAAWAQVAAAVLVLLRPGRRSLVLGSLVQVALVAAWAVSRTSGLPVGPDRWTPEAVGTADLVTVGLEVAFVVVAVFALTARRRLPVLAGLVASAVILGGTTAALVTPSVMAHHHDETAGAAAAGHVHVHGATAVVSGGTAGLDGAHAHSHIVTSTGPPTGEEIARADQLIAATRRSIPRWSDPAAAEAAGFRAIQGPSSDYVHFVNFRWLTDGTVLDPEHPESLVYRSTNGTRAGYRLESAMYILPSYGYPIPDVGGSLTPWHNHGDLCFGARGMIVGSTTNGACPAGSSNVKTPDMLHVWIVDHLDGPFGGIEAVK